MGIFLAWYVVGHLFGIEEGTDLGGREHREMGVSVFAIWGAVAVVAFLPALVLGAVAARLPRVLRLECRSCGWSREVLLPHHPGPKTAREETPGEPFRKA
jgi:hypothetical protein